MKKTAVILSTYALMLLVGGTIGYFVAGSLLSLIASSVSVALLAVGIYALYTHNFWGYPFSIVVVSLLALFFLYRCIKTLAIMPSGMIFLISISYDLFLIRMMLTRISHKSRVG